jgi:hypothetical protein
VMATHRRKDAPYSTIGLPSGANLTLGTRGSAGQTARSDGRAEAAVVQNSRILFNGISRA